MKEQGKKKATNEKKQHQPNYKEYLVSVDEIKDYLMDHYLLRRNMVKGGWNTGSLPRAAARLQHGNR